MHDDATQAGPNGGSDSRDEGTRADSSSSTKQPPPEHINGTGRPTIAQQEQALLTAFGECVRRSRIAKRPLWHCWHGTGVPIQTPNSRVLHRICCYCAPEGIGIVVQAALSDDQIKAEQQKHGPRLVIEKIEIKARTGLILPGVNDVPPDMR